MRWRWRMRGSWFDGAFERNVLVTGCGSSGTAYVAELLRANSVRVTHDTHLGRDGIVTNACDGRFVTIYDFGRHGDRGYAVARIAVPEFRHRFHLVRAPLQVIGSALQKWSDYGGVWPHVLESFPDLAKPGAPTLRTAALYWVLQNELVAPVTQQRFRVEDLSVDATPLLDAIGVKPRVRTLATRPHGSGATAYPSWSDIAVEDGDVAARARRLATDYGYH